MPQIISLHDKNAIEVFVQRNPFLHLLELGDLDDFFWPYTIWYGWEVEGAIEQIALVYMALSPPVLLAYGDSPGEQADFIAALLPLLPTRLYAHLDPLVLDIVRTAFQIESHGLFLKMSLTDVSRADEIDTSDVMALTEDDEDALMALYAGFPQSQFTPRNLRTGHYYGLREQGLLVCAGGVHVYSPAYQAAVIGNVMTHPARRRRGLATRVCAHLCQMLMSNHIAYIGLNVEANNDAAIRIYERLGFEKQMEFGAYMLKSY
ncbi:MAG: GNAT family N-acetyltransferase [Anaerolineae bacterium]|nr:GNAT family N-acetyltransferase [Anaerolineae bacterium]